MVLHPTQKEIARDQHRFRVLRCGRRWGKTTLAVEEILGKAVPKKDRRVVYLAPTIGQARDIAWGNMWRRYEPLFAQEPNETRLEFYLKTLDGGSSTVYLKGWEAIQRLRGWKIDFIVPDEIREMKDWWAGWEEVLRPALADVRGEGLFMSTPNGFDHFYDLSNLQEKDSDFKSFHFTSYDNPFIPKDELEKMKREMTDDRYAQEVLAEFRKKQGLVYPEFDRQKHVYQDGAPGQYMRLLGVDFGYTNPTAVLTVIQDNDNHFWVTDEWYKTGKTNTEVIEYARTLNGNAVYPDPAEPDRIEEMRRAGLNIREVSKDVEKGVDSVREIIKQGRLHVHASCVNLISEIETYSYPDKKTNNNEPESPIKEHDHALDALRYVLHMASPAVEMSEDFGLYEASYA